MGVHPCEGSCGRNLSPLGLENTHCKADSLAMRNRVPYEGVLSNLALSKKTGILSQQD